MSIFKSVSRNMVGAFAMSMAAGIIAGLFLMEIPAGNRDVAMVSLGVALGWAGAVVQFHFGSSEGSKSKTDLIAAQATGKVEDAVHVVDDTEKG
jgi:DNA mismatch repair protein MutH